MSLFFDLIIVPQGAEYQAIDRGLKQCDFEDKPPLLAIPMGVKALSSFLAEREWQKPQNILVMGLCGSLSDRYGIGDVVLYRDCLFSSSTSLQHRYTDRQLTTYISNHLQNKTSLVTSLTSDRLIWSAREKRDLNRQYQAGVVDMEGFILLDRLSQYNHKIAMLRVVSDNAKHNIPQIDRAISSSGQLKSIPMAIAMIQQPIAAGRLISGAMTGLKILQQITTELFKRSCK